MGKRRNNKDQEEQEKAKETASQEYILQMMKNFYENITALIKSSFENHIEVPQRQVFDIKLAQDKDHKKIKHLEQRKKETYIYGNDWESHNTEVKVEVMI